MTPAKPAPRYLTGEVARLNDIVYAHHVKRSLSSVVAVGNDYISVRRLSTGAVTRYCNAQRYRLESASEGKSVRETVEEFKRSQPGMIERTIIEMEAEGAFDDLPPLPPEPAPKVRSSL